MSDWQPIETAPKDGTWVLVHRAHWYLPELVQWTYRGYWESWAHGPFQPTHWIPVPLPPDAMRVAD